MTTAIPSVSQVITQPSIHTYADLSGDYHPVHVDEEFAAKTPFGGTIAHGPIALQTLFASLTPTSPARHPLFARRSSPRGRRLSCGQS